MKEINKEQLYLYCMDVVQSRIEAAKQAIRSAREGSDNETKSSAGDKYETAREMMQQEIDRNQAQLAEAKKLLHTLNQIDPKKTCEIVEPGSFVSTSDGSFYISISTGKITIEDETIFGISLASPIGRLLRGLKAGDDFEFNQKRITIRTIC